MLRSRISVLARLLTSVILTCLVGCVFDPYGRGDDEATKCKPEGFPCQLDANCCQGQRLVCIREPAEGEGEGECVAPIWSDEFDGRAIDPANWEHMIGDGTAYGLPAGWGNGELQHYTDRPDNSFVAGGYLHIVAREEPFAGYNYTSARLRTKCNQDFLYGRLEARMQLPTGQGMWPAFWMLPTDEAYGGWAASGEIDIMESANIPTAIDGTIHFGGPWPNNIFSGGTFSDDTDFSGGFHTFAIEWRADAILWYVDGVRYHTETSANWYSDGAPGNGRAPFDQHFHLLLNVAVGGRFPSPPDGSTAFPQEMLVDWVRVYEFAESQSPGQCSSVQFEAPTYSATEDAGSATIAVTRSGGQTGEIMVTYTTSDGTAAAGLDYIAAAGTLVFATGETSKSFTVTVLDDTVVEGDETVNLVLSNPTGGALLGDPSTAILTIGAEPPHPQVQFSAEAYSVEEDDGSATITVTRTDGDAGQVTVVYTTSGGTATAESDYVTAAGTLIFAEGDTSKSFTVAILDDALVEGDETVNLVLSDPTGGASLGEPSTAVLTILDDGPPPPGRVQFNAQAYIVSEDDGSATITVTRSGGQTSGLTVTYVSSDGTATAGSDYVAAAGTLVFAAGDTSKSFAVPILDDALVEGDETVNLVLSNPTGPALLGDPSTAVLTIVDGDEPRPGQVQFNAQAYVVSEDDGSATIIVTRTGGNAGQVGIAYATGDGTAAAGSDYVTAAGTLIFAEGDTSKDFTVAILNDALVEGDETVNLVLSNPTGGASLGGPSTGVLTIVDDDVEDPGQVQLNSQAYSVAEDDGSATIIVTRTGGSAGQVTVVYTTSDGTATAGPDYVTAAGTLNFAEGDTSKDFTVAILNDALVEGDETVNLVLSNPTGGALLGDPSTGVLTIVDDDEPSPGQLQFNAQAYIVSEDDGSATITVTRSGGQTGGLTVTYTSSDGTATAGSDYVTAAGTLNFAEGDTSKNFTVAILDDALVEGDETVNLVLSDPTGGALLGDPSSAELTILDDDEPAQVQLSAQDYSVLEDAGSTTITVTRTGDDTTQVGVSYTTSGGTATAGADYVTAAGTLVFAAGDNSESFTVTVFDDTVGEDDETINLVLSNPTGGATLGNPSSAVLTIVDDDECDGESDSYQYPDFTLTNVCTYEDNWCGWADRPGKAVVYGEMSKVVQVPPSCDKLDVTISIPCNGWGEGLAGPDGSSAHIIVNGVIRAETIDDTMDFHHNAFYRYESCESFVNTFDVTGEAQAELIIRMNGGASMDFQQAELEFYRD